jgi:hypothetical protein
LTEDERNDNYDEDDSAHDKRNVRDERNTAHKESVYECKLCSCLTTVSGISVSIFAFCFSDLPDYNVTTTKLQLETNDRNVDIFLIFEEMVAMDGKAPSMARKDLCEILEKKRKLFVKCFHVIAVHPKLQAYLVRQLHNTVHAGLLRPAIEPFLRAIAKEGKPHVYYSASAHSHMNSFLRILNGREVTKLKSFPKLDFKVAMSKLKTGVVGQRWNIQHTWGVASLNMKRNDACGLINVPMIKSENVTDNILLLLEIDKSHEFYCGLPEGEE